MNEYSANRYLGQNRAAERLHDNDRYIRQIAKAQLKQHNAWHRRAWRAIKQLIKR